MSVTRSTTRCRWSCSSKAKLSLEVLSAHTTEDASMSTKHRRKSKAFSCGSNNGSSCWLIILTCTVNSELRSQGHTGRKFISPSRNWRARMWSALISVQIINRSWCCETMILKSLMTSFGLQYALRPLSSWRRTLFLQETKSFIRLSKPTHLSKAKKNWRF